MKKLIIVLCILLLATFFVACNNNDTTEPEYGITTEDTNDKDISNGNNSDIDNGTNDNDNGDTTQSELHLILENENEYHEPDLSDASYIHELAFDNATGIRLVFRTNIVIRDFSLVWVDIVGTTSEGSYRISYLPGEVIGTIDEFLPDQIIVANYFILSYDEISVLPNLGVYLTDETGQRRLFLITDFRDVSKAPAVYNVMEVNVGIRM